MNVEIYRGPPAFTVTQLEQATERLAHVAQLATLASTGAMVSEREALEALEAFEALVPGDHTGPMVEQFAMTHGDDDVNVWASEIVAAFMHAWGGMAPCAVCRDVLPSVRVMVIGGQDEEDPADHKAWWSTWIMQRCGALELLTVT
jgi:hypothetical protein